MIAVISPAKTLDFETAHEGNFTSPRFQKETVRLAKTLKKKKEKDLKSLMNISDALAALNVDRYQNFSGDENAKISRPAIHAFKGDVYIGLAAESLSNEALDFAQDHLRILSGLYGVLRPLDLIEPYRLEMGTKLKIGKYENLYQFWGGKIAKELSKDLKENGSDIILNLASKEYFKSVNKKELKGRIIDVEFKDFSNDKYKIISFFAKKARGLMSRYMIDHQITDPEKLKGFDMEGYYFVDSESTEDSYIFHRG
ncbi:MAG: peroxide stress protein YaaA [Cyclobacteriaceae bacterium]